MANHQPIELTALITVRTFLDARRKTDPASMCVKSWVVGAVAGAYHLDVFQNEGTDRQLPTPPQPLTSEDILQAAYAVVDEVLADNGEDEEKRAETYSMPASVAAILAMGSLYKGKE